MFEGILDVDELVGIVSYMSPDPKTLPPDDPDDSGIAKWPSFTRGSNPKWIKSKN